MAYLILCTQIYRILLIEAVNIILEWEWGGYFTVVSLTHIAAIRSEVIVYQAFLFF